MRRFLLDIESTSPVALKATGAAVYWADPRTILICVCYQVDDGPRIMWEPGEPAPLIVRDIAPGEWRVVAHNYLFEFHAWAEVLTFYGWSLPKHECWDCTMARALYWGLPAGLADVCGALSLPVQIDPAKKLRIKRMARPRGGTLAAPTYWHLTDPARLQELLDDCDRDVAAEGLLDAALPPLPDFERKIFLIDMDINLRGVAIDPAMIAALDVLVYHEQARLNRELARLTGITSTAKVTQLLGWVHERGTQIASLAKADVAAAIADPVTPEAARAVLRLRAEAAKASTGKLRAMTAGANADGRCRGLFQYGGAGRTMRWAGRRVQPQNYPRGSLKLAGSAFRLVMAGVSAEDFNALLPCSVMDAASSMLRGCLVAPPGRVLVSADLAQIEARVVAWLAGQANILSVFAKGEDVYTYTAKRIGSTDRQLGKVLVLACGFGMGAPKFQETALTYGMRLTLDEAIDYVSAWRDANTKIVDFWYALDREFKAIAASPHGTRGRVGPHITLRKTSRAVRIGLPSGREMTYQQVQLGHDDQGRETISYMGVHPKTKQWGLVRTYGGKLAENVTQAVARDVMGDAMIRLSWPAVPSPDLIGTVHDELLGECDAAAGPVALATTLAAMRTAPPWAPGLPVGAEGWIGPRYKK